MAENERKLLKERILPIDESGSEPLRKKPLGKLLREGGVRALGALLEESLMHGLKACGAGVIAWAVIALPQISVEQGLPKPIKLPEHEMAIHIEPVCKEGAEVKITILPDRVVATDIGGCNHTIWLVPTVSSERSY